MTTPSTAAAGDPLVARTVAVGLDEVGSLLDLLPTDAPVSWLRRDEGLVGWGVAAVIRTRGTARFSDADKWWSEITGRAEVQDAVNEPGTGLVAFGSFGFADDPGESVLVVPQVVVGRRGDRAWLTTVGVDVPDLTPAPLPTPPAGLSFADGALNGEAWMSVVADAVTRINAG